MSLEYRVGDVWDRLKEIPDGSIDLIVTSPPFLALRSYLPADHPLKAKEIGSEATPAAYIDTLLALTAEIGRVVAPHGSLCVELGDTFANVAPSGNAYGAKPSSMTAKIGDTQQWNGGENVPTIAKLGTGWPLAKSLTGIPTLYPWSLAYGRNLLTGEPSPAGLWRIRNIIVWGRPNPPVGALGDKFRPATSYITVACRGVRRFFDLDAVRTPYAVPDQVRPALSTFNNPTDGLSGRTRLGEFCATDGAGAPPLDWHTDNHPEDGDWLWKLPTQPYKGSHYATWNLALPTKLILAMCPRWVCDKCGMTIGSSYDQDVRGVSPALSGTTVASQRGTEGNGNGPLLQPDLFQQGQRADTAIHQGVRHLTEGISATTDADSSDGGSDGLRDGASLRDGSAHRPGSPTRGDRPPRQWDQGRQPHRESDADVEGRPRQTSQAATSAAPMSVVRKPDSDAKECPTCKGVMRVGRVLDPFCGSGTTLEAAQNVGRHAIGIDLDPRNADLARSRVGMFLTVEDAHVS